MIHLPKAIQNLIEAFERLPGIGPKTAQRLSFYLLSVPQSEREQLGSAVLSLGAETQICEVCANVDDCSPCRVCQDSTRDRSVICVVESPLNIITMEKSGFRGLYHVLHGQLSPLNSIGPDELYIQSLLPRLDGEVTEVILATNPSMEGEATAMYLKKIISSSGVNITRIGRGLPIGGDLEYADEGTLKQALEGRRDY